MNKKLMLSYVIIVATFVCVLAVIFVFSSNGNNRHNEKYAYDTRNNIFKESEGNKNEKLDKVNSTSNVSHKVLHYFSEVLGHKTPGQIVFSSDCTAKTLIQQSNVVLPYELDLNSNIITVSQFVNLPSQFEFRDKTLGFKLDLASWGHFKFRGDNQEFIELSFLTTPSAIEMKEGVKEIKKLVQKLDAAGWKRAAGFENSLTEDGLIEGKLQLEQKKDSLGPKVMAWQSKNYQIALHATMASDDDEEHTKIEDKVSLEISIKKIW